AACRGRLVPEGSPLSRSRAPALTGPRSPPARRYVTEVEGYPGLVVHGPLLATLLIDLLRRNRPGVLVRRFEFRALAPLFDIAPFDVCGRPEEEGRCMLWAQGIDGAPAMSATATVT